MLAEGIGNLKISKDPAGNRNRNLPIFEQCSLPLCEAETEMYSIKYGFHTYFKPVSATFSMEEPPKIIFKFRRQRDSENVYTTGKVDTRGRNSSTAALLLRIFCVCTCKPTYTERKK